MIDTMRSEKANCRTVAVLVADGVSSFELSVALAVFGPQDGVGSPDTWYRLGVCGVGGRTGSVRADPGMRVDLTHGLRYAMTADLVVVPPHNDERSVPAEIVETIRLAHRRGARVASLCTGAFLVAAAGLLNGRRATTHWSSCPDLARRYPQVDVDPDVLYVDNGDVLTSAGAAASLDLCLHLVRLDRGADVAADLARDLVVPPHRDGGQAQYIRTPLPDPAADSLFTEVLTWMQEHLADDIQVTDLARRSAMSRRTFARRFVHSTGTTPYQWLLRHRLQLAQQLLERTDLSTEAVAARSGFTSASNLRKHFSRMAHTSPAAYRKAFAQSRPTSPI